MWQFAVDDLLRMIWLWVLIGILVSGGLTVAFCIYLVRHAGVAILAASCGGLVISLPLYVCATASVPIAAALLAGGLPAGAALVLLMAGPATNVATIGAIGRGLGKRALIVYLTVVIGGSLGLAVLYDFMIGLSVESHAMNHHEHQHWWSLACAIVVMILFVRFAVMALARQLHRPHQAP